MHTGEMVKQSLPLLILCGFGAILTWSTLSGMTEILESIPGLIVVIPGVIAMRGNISTALGSRLGSAYHLGLIDVDNLWNNDLKQNILGSLVLSVLVSIIIGFLAYLTSLLLNVSPDPLKLILIVLLGGVSSAIILTSLTIGIVYVVFKKGYDPDNITGPTLATIGDIITMLCILGSAYLVEVIL
ncbi:MAG TPA: divalent cation transporter [Thermoplasmatales archaeon]|nr:divalent cation transporter [Thermoplasmatales archaeon]